MTSFKLFARVVVVSALTISIVSAAYNPDDDAPTDKLIRGHEYECQSHDVTTDDGYRLTLHRIPRGRNVHAKKKTPVYLQHGLMGSSADWIIQGPAKSLAFRLADEGHDVWLGNVRGNTYSRAHVSKDPDEDEFWKFSFHEMAIKDVAKTIDYILNKTGSEQLYYIGHSMGTTMFWVLCAERPEYNAKIKLMFALAPIAFMGDVRTPFRMLADHTEAVQSLFDMGHGEFARRDYYLNKATKKLCELSNLEGIVCESIMFAMCGYDPDEFDPKLLNILLGHTPAGTSTNTLVHYAQLIKSGEFRQFDYGLYFNKKRYGQDTPPDYNLKNVVAPVVLYYAANDLLANLTDISRLENALPDSNPSQKSELIEDKDFNHLDFLYSKDVNSLLFDKIIRLIGAFESGQPTHSSNVNHAEMIIPNRNENPVFNDFSSSLERQQAYPIDKEILDNVANLKIMAENRLEIINEKAKLAINRNLKSFKHLLMLELKKYNNGTNSFAENRWKNEADLY